MYLLLKHLIEYRLQFLYQRPYFFRCFGYPRKAGHSLPSITYPHPLFALPRPGQLLNVR
jgi:hypothetical protein